jgi:hypothetical protein
VQVLWLQVLLLISAFAMFEDILQDMVGLIVLVYLLATRALVVRRLMTLRQDRPI